MKLFWETVPSVRFVSLGFVCLLSLSFLILLIVPFRVLMIRFVTEYRLFYTKRYIKNKWEQKVVIQTPNFFRCTDEITSTQT